MRTIIFDFDGTIADTFKLNIEIAHQLTGHPSLINASEVKELKKASMIEVAKDLDIPKYMWPFLLFRGRRIMSSRLNEVKPFEGIDEVLEALHKNGYRMYVMSTNSTKNIAYFLTSHGLSGYIKKIYGGVGLVAKAGALRKILKQNKLKPGDAIYVGDEVRDIEAAKDVDVPVVAVAWGFNDPDRLAQEAPMVLVHNRPQLLKVLESWEIS
ncbi:MAG TPA: HAD hydrolase-like protein [Candidatus Saccharimonadales bacterium]